jgi:biotin carboxyl carrier protein
MTREKPALDPMLQRMLKLVTLHRQARHKTKPADLAFLMVNQTFNLVPYRQCFFWRLDDGAANIEAASGLVSLDADGPMALWLKSVVSRFLKGKDLVPPSNPEGKSAEEAYAKAFPIKPADCSDADRTHWADWASPNAVVLAMGGKDHKIRYGLWVDREQPFDVGEIALLEDIGDSYAFALEKLEAKSVAAAGLRGWFGRRIRYSFLLIALSAAAVMPVRMSVTAPAEVVARSPLVVSVPFEGIIESVEVKPNQVVKKGDLLAVMDDTALRNRSEMMGQELMTAAAELTKTEREALKDPTKLPELNILKSQMEAKRADKKYADELLSKIRITADMDGVVIFPDVNALRGKPVQAGEQIMLMSDPSDSELLVRIPVDGMITLDPAASVDYFLNISPLASQHAKIESVSYQATPDHDGLLTYKVRAKFEAGETPPRLGSSGSAKAYGDKTMLIFNVIRRPLVTVRRKLGI